MTRSTCHWCHVMERESFEDDEVAELLNRHFVSIKVDREERPDIDHIYMTVCQALTGQGGWPLTVLLTPDREPFFAGTYFPKHRRFGRPGLLDILRRVAQAWEKNRDALVRQAQELTEQLRPYYHATSPGAVDDGLLDRAVEAFQAAFDPEYGGFGSAPKFPVPHNLMFLLRYGWLRNRSDVIAMVDKTLESMYRGGIYDHVGSGFARYSTDRRWLVPHFEKMLYDNALLAIAYLEGFQVTSRTLYANVARDVLNYVLRDMTDHEGGFYSAEDADSEGVEGKFYLWTVDEVVSVLGDARGHRYCRCYDITEAGNFEGKNIPNLVRHSLESFAASEGLDPDRWLEEVRQMNAELFEQRKKRVHPHKDDKILTGWNGLMMAALARAGRVLQEPRYVEAARRAADFVARRLTRSDGRLLARYRDGEAAHLAYADDYAYVIWALLELYDATFEVTYLQRALSLQQDMTRLFWDDDEAGFFFYGSDAEGLIARPKVSDDGALPSGNSVAAFNLIRLARYTGDPAWEMQAERLLNAFAGDASKYPIGHGFYLMAALTAREPAVEVVLTGHREDEETQAAIRMLQTAYAPQVVALFRPDGEEGEAVAALAPFVSEQRPLQGRPTVYICENFSCRAPRTDWREALQEVIQTGRGAAP